MEMFLLSNMAGKTDAMVEQDKQDRDSHRLVERSQTRGSERHIAWFGVNFVDVSQHSVTIVAVCIHFVAVLQRSERLLQE